MKYFPAVAFTTLALGFIFLGIIFYWLWWSDQIVTVQAQEIAVNKEVYKPGERIAYTFSYCKTQQIPGTVTRAIVNDIRITYTDIYSDLPIGCHTVTVADLTVPDFLPSGLYHLEVSGEYQVNPLRVDRNSWRTVDFQVK